MSGNKTFLTMLAERDTAFTADIPLAGLRLSGVEGLVEGLSLANLLERPGEMEAAEAHADGAGVDPAAKLLAEAPVDLCGDSGRSEDVSEGTLLDHPGDEAAQQHRPARAEILVLLWSRRLLLAERGDASNQLAHLLGRLFERLVALQDPGQLPGGDSALLAMEGLLLYVQGLFLPVVLDLRLELGNPLCDRLAPATV